MGLVIIMGNYRKIPHYNDEVQAKYLISNNEILHHRLRSGIVIGCNAWKTAKSYTECEEYLHYD